MNSNRWEVYNRGGKYRVLVTKMLPGDQWLRILEEANYQIEVSTSNTLNSKDTLIKKIKGHCAGAIGQLTEQWDEDVLEALNKADGRIYCNYAVGYDNVDLKAATEKGIAVGNTPGVLTETTAELAVALTLACARRVVESDRYVRKDQYQGWLPKLFLGKRLTGQTVGVVGAGRIGSAYAKLMTSGFGMDVIYFSRSKNVKLEEDIARNRDSNIIKRANSLKNLLKNSNIVSLHTPLNKGTYHLIGAEQLSQMKDDAILINTSRGAVVDEAALAKHCKKNIQFKAGLDVFENEPIVNDDLKGLKNVTLTPHIGSATRWTREAMALLASLNIKGVIEEYPVWKEERISPFLEITPPNAIPSIVNSKSLNFNAN